MNGHGVIGKMNHLTDMIHILTVNPTQSLLHTVISIHSSMIWMYLYQQQESETLSDKFFPTTLPAAGRWSKVKFSVT